MIILNIAGTVRKRRGVAIFDSKAPRLHIAAQADSKQSAMRKLWTEVAYRISSGSPTALAGWLSYAGLIGNSEIRRVRRQRKARLYVNFGRGANDRAEVA